VPQIVNIDVMACIKSDSGRIGIRRVPGKRFEAPAAAIDGAMMAG
jgi:hypothetical protein